MSIVSTVHMQQHQLRSYYFVDQIPRCTSIAAAHNHHCNGNILALLEHRIYCYTMTKNRSGLASLCLNITSTTTLYKEQTSSLASLEARWLACMLSMLSRPFEMSGTLRHSFENESLWPPLFIHTALQLQPIVGVLNLQQIIPFVPSRLGHGL